MRFDGVEKTDQTGGLFLFGQAFLVLRNGRQSSESTMSSSIRSFRSPAHHQPYHDQDSSPLDSYRPSHEQDEEAVELLKSDLRFRDDSISEINLEREHHSGLLRPRWSTLRTVLARLQSGWDNPGNSRPFLSADESGLGRAQKRSVRFKALRWLLYFIIAFFMML